MQDRRNEDRHRTLAAGHLDLSAGAGRIGCVLRDLSAGGARLRLDGPGAPLGAHVLAAEACGGARPVWIAWRADGELGVMFLDRGAAPTKPATGPEPARAEAAGDDAARLKARIAAVTRPRARPLPAWIDAP